MVFGGSLVFGAWCLMFLEGCSVGPNYKRPVMESPAMFRGDNASTNSSFADLDWWQVYQDTTLQELVREALTNNYDLRIAIARVEQARALAMQARSQFVPSVNYDGVVSRGRNEVFGSATAKVIMGGTSEPDFLEQMSQLGDEVEVASESMTTTASVG